MQSPQSRTKKSKFIKRQWDEMSNASDEMAGRVDECVGTFFARYLNDYVVVLRKFGAHRVRMNTVNHGVIA